jgi:hypothetical protein
MAFKYIIFIIFLNLPSPPGCKWSLCKTSASSGAPAVHTAGSRRVSKATYNRHANAREYDQNSGICYSPKSVAVLQQSTHTMVHPITLEKSGKGKKKQVKYIAWILAYMR